MRPAALSLVCAAFLTIGAGTSAAAGQTVTIPGSIDSTGQQTVSSALNRFINSVPDGSTIRFKADATYRLDQALHIDRRRHLTLNGNGARLILPRTHVGNESTGIIVRSSVGTTIRNLRIVGNNHEAGTRDACCRRESQFAIGVLSSRDTLIKRVRIRRTWGDCLYVSRSSSGGRSHGVTFRDSTCRLAGRHGVGLIAGSNILIAGNTFDQLGFDVVDIEPNTHFEGARDVVVRGNRIGSFGLGGQYDAWLLAACGADGSVIREVKVARNMIEGNRMGWGGQVKALHMKVCGDGDRVRDGFKVIRNTAKAQVRGPSLYFYGVRGVTVRGNKQPLTSGSLVYRARSR
jgi:hypothetical protein